MSRGMSKQSKLGRCLRAPGRALKKARELYVRGMTECAGRLGGSSLMAAQAPSLPRSFSSASSRSYINDEDARELMRAASTRNRMLGLTKIEDADLPEPEPKRPMRRNATTAARSCSVAIGRIDENEECEFEDGGMAVVYPRSRSTAYGDVPKVRTAALRKAF